MRTSETYLKLMDALHKAQGKIEHAQKDGSNTHTNKSYATIESVINASKKALIDEGILVLQYVKERVLVTRLQHKEGEWLEVDTELIIGKQDMQGLGSAITYARRYSLTSILNMAQTDDDGNLTAKAAKPPARVVSKPSKAVNEDKLFE